MSSRAYPACGTNRVSIPRAVPDKTDLRLVHRFECAGNGQRGNNVAARAAAGNEDPHARQSISRVRFSSTPMLASVKNRDVPPEEMKGSGMPLVGTSAAPR